MTEPTPPVLSGDGAPADLDVQDAGQSGDPSAFRPLGHRPDGIDNGRYDPAAFEALDFYRVDDLLTVLVELFQG